MFSKGVWGGGSGLASCSILCPGRTLSYATALEFRIPAGTLPENVQQVANMNSSIKYIYFVCVSLLCTRKEGQTDSINI